MERARHSPRRAHRPVGAAPAHRPASVCRRRGKTALRLHHAWLRLLSVWALIATAIAFAAAPAHAAPPDRQATLPIAAAPWGHTTPLAVCVAPAAPGETAREAFARIARRPCRASYPRSVEADADYWFLLRPAHAGDSLQLPLLTYHPGWQSGAQLALRYADGGITTLRLDNARLAGFSRSGSYVGIPLPARRGVPVTGLLLRVDKLWATPNYLTHIALMDEPAAARLTRDEVRVYALFYGTCLTLLVSNLLLWLCVRQAYQIAFCLNLVVILAWAMVHGGAPLDGALQFRIDWLSRALRIATWLVLWNQVLPRTTVGPVLRRLVIVVMTLLVATATVQFALPAAWMRLSGVAITLVYLAFQTLTIIAALAALRRHTVSVKIALLLVESPSVIAVTFLFERLSGQDLAPDHAMLIALASESLLSTLVMAIHIKRIIGERDTARAEELAARRLADIDPLTGLLNRRALLDRILRQAGGAPQRLLLIDVDHFKAINDTHGHDIGDTVLRELAALLGRRTRGGCVIGRLGGEEFALVGPAGDLNAAAALGIVNDVRGHQFAGHHRITVSIGTTEGPITSEATWSALYRRADSALYAAKGAGRNRVIDLPGDATLVDPITQRQRVPARRSS